MRAIFTISRNLARMGFTVKDPMTGNLAVTVEILSIFYTANRQSYNPINTCNKQGRLYVENYTDVIETKNIKNTIKKTKLKKNKKYNWDSCFELVGTRQHGVAAKSGMFN